jgi:hypothetical protein
MVRNTYKIHENMFIGLNKISALHAHRNDNATILPAPLLGKEHRNETRRGKRIETTMDNCFL